MVRVREAVQAAARPAAQAMPMVSADAPVHLTPGQGPLELLGQPVLAVWGGGGLVSFVVFTTATMILVFELGPLDESDVG